jgi:hypothetical protein
MLQIYMMWLSFHRLHQVTLTSFRSGFDLKRQTVCIQNAQNGAKWVWTGNMEPVLARFEYKRFWASETRFAVLTANDETCFRRFDMKRENVRKGVCIKTHETCLHANALHCMKRVCMQTLWDAWNAFACKRNGMVKHVCMQMLKACFAARFRSRFLRLEA